MKTIPKYRETKKKQHHDEKSATTDNRLVSNYESLQIFIYYIDVANKSCGNSCRALTALNREYLNCTGTQLQCHTHKCLSFFQQATIQDWNSVKLTLVAEYGTIMLWPYDYIMTSIAKSSTASVYYIVEFSLDIEYLVEIPTLRYNRVNFKTLVGSEGNRTATHVLYRFASAFGTSLFIYLRVTRY